MKIDHIITYPMIYLALCISRIDENITDWKVYSMLDTLYNNNMSQNHSQLH